MQLVETIEVPSGGASSIEFTSIPQDADDLLLTLSANDSGSEMLRATFNNDTGANYSRIYLRGSGSSVFTQSVTGQSFIRVSPPQVAGNTFSSSSVYIPNYTASSAKSLSMDMVSEDNATTAYQFIWAGNWNNTNAISSIQIYIAAGTIAQYSSFSLYKITKA